MTNKELYDLWIKGKARLITMTQADWDIDWGQPKSRLAHELLIEYKEKQYWIQIEDESLPNGTIVKNPNKEIKETK